MDSVVLLEEVGKGGGVSVIVIDFLVFGRLG